jgi:UDP-N-acetylglucosamine 2-epimerase (non-hydrolysing)
MITMKLAIVIGTRPEVIKMASILQILDKRGIEYTLIHTGQHYDRKLSAVFFEELELPQPAYFLDVGSGTHAEQTSTAMIKLEKTFIRTKTKLMLTQGDTNSVLASALAAIKLDIMVAHVEAGLRCYDLRMPEEHNRRLVDHLSKLLFAPTRHAGNNLKRENVWGKIYITGNTVIDACKIYMREAEKRSRIHDDIRFDTYALVTAHRAENVDNPKNAKNLVNIILNCPLSVVYPLHPRTANRFKKYGIYNRLVRSNNVQVLPPVGYFDFLMLMKHSRFILSDSGGIQEEASAPWIKKKVFVLRETTERPEAVKAGYAEVVGTDTDTVLQALNRFMSSTWLPGRCPFGRGDAGMKIIDILETFI